MEYNYDRRQLMALAYVASLAPILRLLPRYAARISGSTAWLCPLAALPGLILFVLFLNGYMKQCKSGEGLGELILRTDGKIIGTAALVLIAAVLVMCSGFILLTGADRLISTIYPASGPWFFSLIMLTLGTIAALGPFKALPRAARIFSPVITLVLVIVLVFALYKADLNHLLPIRRAEPGKLLFSSLAVLEVYGGILTYTAIMEWQSRPGGGRTKGYIRRLCLICLLLTAVCAAVIGSYGAELVSRFSHPFFSMIRDVELFSTVERIEAVVVALWVLPDFAVFSLMLSAASHLLRISFGFRPESAAVPMLQMSNGRWIIPLVSALAIASAALISNSSIKTETFSQYIIPGATIAVVFILIPICRLTALIRQKRNGRP